MQARFVRFAPIVLVSVCAVTANAEVDLNLGFETLDADGAPLGWRGADAAIASDDELAVEGERSLKIVRAAPAGVTRLAQRLPAAALREGEAARAPRLRLRGAVRADTPAVAPALWLRIDGPAGPLFLDSYGYGREPSDASATAVAALASGEWQSYELELPLPPDVEEVAFGLALRGSGTAWFDALELTVVAVDSRPPPSAAAVRYLDAALALMREHALRRADVDWPAVRRAALEHARGAVTPADTHLAVRFAVRELGDRHSYLQSARVSQALARSAVSNARTGSPLTPPHGRLLDGNLVYLHVPGFAGGTPAEQLEFAEALSDLIRVHDSAGACGWLLDLRQNSGGNLWPMLAGVGALLGDGELAASVYPDGRRVAVWYRDGQAGFGDYTQLRVRSPYRLRSPSPLAVLLGPGTASSAEVLAVAARGRGLTRSFGAPTRGLSAGNRTFALADGASLVLTVAATGDAAGRIVTGQIVPDEPTARPAAGGSGESGSDAALDAAATWLASRDACR